MTGQPRISTHHFALACRLVTTVASVVQTNVLRNRRMVMMKALGGSTMVLSGSSLHECWFFIDCELHNGVLSYCLRTK